MLLDESMTPPSTAAHPCMYPYASIHECISTCVSAPALAAARIRTRCTCHSMRSMHSVHGMHSAHGMHGMHAMAGVLSHLIWLHMYLQFTTCHDDPCQDPMHAYKCLLHM